MYNLFLIFSKCDRDKFWRHSRFITGLGTAKSIKKFNGPGRIERFNFYAAEVSIAAQKIYLTICICHNMVGHCSECVSVYKAIYIYNR